MKNVMQELADDIALGLVEKLQQRKADPVPPAPSARDMLLERFAQESVGRLDMVQTGTPSERQALLQRLEQVENTLQILAAQIRLGQAEPEAESNHSEEGSKYQNVDTLLKYVDGPGAEGGVKLVIMNFND